MGTKRAKQKQEALFYASERVETHGHPFYEQLNGVLDDAGFDKFCEEQCRDFYHTKLGRPSLAPGVYFRLLLIGFFEGLGSERGIGWRVADSFSLRRFLNYGWDQATPDHVTISRTRRLLDEATHQAVFTFVLTEVARRGMLKGKTIGIDATSLEANAAMRSIVRRDTGESYMAYLRRLAVEAGLDGDDDDAVRRMDRKRKKKTSNEEWVNPHDPEAEVTKMKDGTTHLSYKAEQAVDLDTGVIVAITTQGGATGDSESVQETLPAAGFAVAEQIDTPTAQGSYQVHEQGLREVVTDKGYHSGAGLAEMSESVRTYVSVPQQPRRHWQGKAEQQAAVYANRRRVEGERGKRLLRRRGELLERPFAHQYETGAMRRLHVRGRGNVAKRVLLQAAAFNLALILRSITTAGTPKGLADLKRKVVLALLRVLAALWALPAPIFGVYETSAIRSSLSDRVRPNPPKLRPSGKSRF
ncbi:MAG: transposase [Candidatus Acidiferrum sp.]